MGATAVLIGVRADGRTTFFPTWTRDVIEGAEYAFAARVVSRLARLGLERGAAAFTRLPRAAQAEGALWSAVEWYLDEVIDGGGEGAAAEERDRIEEGHVFQAACVLDLDARAVDFHRPGPLPTSRHPRGPDLVPGLACALRVREDDLARAGGLLEDLLARVVDGEAMSPDGAAAWEERLVHDGDESMIEAADDQGDDLLGAHVTLGADGEMRVARPFSAVVPTDGRPGHLDLYVVTRPAGLLARLAGLVRGGGGRRVQWATAVSSGQPVMLCAETGPYEVWKQTVPEGALDPVMLATGLLAPDDVARAVDFRAASRIDRGVLA